MLSIKTKLYSDLDSIKTIKVFKTSASKSITKESSGYWHEVITIPTGYKVIYVSATFDNADNCMLTSYGTAVNCIGKTSNIEPWFGYYAIGTATGTFTAYAVCMKI